MADCLRGLCDPGKGLPSSRISTTNAILRIERRR
jgi:hypothetical protein